MDSNTPRISSPSSPPPAPVRSPLAILVSGGLDSAILLVQSLHERTVVQPLYIRTGLVWEAVELNHLRRFLEAVRNPRLQPLQLLDLPVGDLYGLHWSITGSDVPDDDSVDEAVFLPGRNVLLLAKGLLWCHLHNTPRLLLGVLKSNPFPDASTAFFAAYQQAVNQAVNGNVVIERPYALLSKPEVMRRGRALPLELTFSCIHPKGNQHCGRCNKCAERRRAFVDADVIDPTRYAAEEPCTA